MRALTSSSVNALPLKSEPIALWSKSSDLYSFLCDLYDDDGEIIDQSQCLGCGRRRPAQIATAYVTEMPSADMMTGLAIPAIM